MTYWFPWPVTALVATTLTACHLYATAHRNDRPGRFSLASGSVIPFALILIPLAFSVKSACGDTGGGIELRSSWLIAGAGAGLGAGVLLACLYAAAGVPRGQVALPAVSILAATALGLLVEYGFSLYSLAVYCEDGSRSVLYGEIAIALIASTLGGWALLRRGEA